MTENAAHLTGAENLRASLRYASPTNTGSADKPERYLDVASVFEKVFPDLSDNSLGERREALLRQAEHYEKRRLHEEAYLNRPLSSEHSSTSSGQTTNSVLSDLSEIEKEYLEDEEWHQKMVEYLAKATKEYTQLDQQLSRVECYIMESRARASSATEENRRVHHLEPLKSSPLLSYLDEQKLRGDGNSVIPKSLIYPSEFYPVKVNPQPERVISPRYRQETASSRLQARSPRTTQQQTRVEKCELESKTSSVEMRTLKPRPPKQTEKASKRAKSAITKPSLSHKGYSRQEDEEHKSIQRELDRMKNTTFDFLKNPRSEEPTIKHLFEPIPAEIRFNKWEVGTVIETQLELRNNDSVSRTVAVLPPENPHFHLGLGRYPSSDGQVGPGLSVLFRVQFMPDSLADDESCLEVRHQSGKMLIPIRAIRPKPNLTLPETIDVGHCLLNSSVRHLIRVVNHGGPGRFCFVREADWPMANFKTAVEPEATRIGAFTVWPTIFEILEGDERDLIVQFEPGNRNEPGEFREELLLTCDNCQTKKITFIGQAERPQIEVIIGEQYKRKAEFGCLRDQFAQGQIEMPTGYPGIAPVASQIDILIRNCTHVELPYQFQFVYPKLVQFDQNQALADDDKSYYDLSAITRELDSVSPFKIYPSSQTLNNQSLAPNATTKFCLMFNPVSPCKFNSVLRITLQSDEKTPKSVLLSSNSDATRILEYELNAECAPITAQLMPSVMNIPGQIPIGSRIKREFYLINNISAADDNPNRTIEFSWSPTETCSVEPSFGCVAPGQSMPLQLCIEASASGLINDHLKCKIECGPVLTLEVTAQIKPPYVTLDCGRLDFGVVEVGSTNPKTVTVMNRSPVEAHFSAATIDEIAIEPDELAIGPMGEATVKVTWSPSKVYDIDNETICASGTEYGQLKLRGSSIRPHVEFSVASITIPDLFVGVKSSITLQLENKGPLEATFRIVDAEQLPSLPDTLQFAVGEHTDLSQLKPYESRRIEIEVISFKKQTINNFIMMADVNNSERPALIEVKGKVRRLEVEVINLSTGQSCQSIDFDINSLYEIRTQRIRLINKTGIKSKFVIKANQLQGQLPKVHHEEEGLVWKPEIKENKQLLQRRACFKQATDITRREFVKQMNAQSTHGMSIISDVSTAELDAFAMQDITIIVAGLSWGKFKDKLTIEIDEMDSIVIDVAINSSVAPLTTPTSFIRLGSVGATDKVSKKVPITNLAPHPVQINFFVLDAFEKALLDEYGELPLPLGDEVEPSENSPFNCGEFVQAVAFGARRVPFNTSRTVHISARSQVHLTIEMDQSQARVGLNTATLLGQLSLSVSDTHHANCNRLTGKKGPVFELPVSATLVANECQIEQIDEFIYSMSLCSLTTQRKAFSAYNPTKTQSTFTLSVTEPYTICLGSSQAQTVEVTLQKSQRKVLSLQLDACASVIDSDFIERSGQMVNRGNLTTRGLANDFTFPIKSTVTLPNIVLSKHELDFGMRTVGDSYEMELVLKNDTLCASDFEFDQLEADQPFTVMTIAGRVPRGESTIVWVRFEPKPIVEQTVYQAALTLNYFNGQATIGLRGTATNDKRYAIGSHLQ